MLFNNAGGHVPQNYAAQFGLLHTHSSLILRFMKRKVDKFFEVNGLHALTAVCPAHLFSVT
jgi:hypothetical protein